MSNEVRSCAIKAPQLEVRASEGQPTTIVGYAAVFNQVTDLFDCGTECYREVIAPGAFTRAIAEKQDVACVIEHDWENVIARSTAGTLILEEDAVGLRVTVTPANTSRSKDLIEDIKAGNIRGMSFRFAVNGIGGQEYREYSEGTKKICLRTVKDVNISDVSFVVFPAYEGTSIQLRSKPEWDIPKPDNTMQRLLKAEAALVCLTGSSVQ